MKFLPQNIKNQHSSRQYAQSNNLIASDQKNSQLEIQNLKFTSQNTSTIKDIKIEFTNKESSVKKLQIKDLVKLISKQPKTQINITQKLFVKFGHLLSLQPNKISEINPQKGFISNCIEFTKKVKQNTKNPEEYQTKNSKIFLNLLFYIMMLLLCGDKEINRNEQFKQKLIGNKTFLKYFLGIEIYKDRKISKLYGLFIVNLFKRNLSIDLKKCMVQSIICNLKYLDHDKSQLNMSMILNQLKSCYKLKEALVKQQNLINKIVQIYFKNQNSFQSVYALNYLIHLSFEYPDLSKFINFNQVKKLEITENIKKFVSSSKLFQKIYPRFFQLYIHKSYAQQAINIGKSIIHNIKQNSEFLESQQKGKIGCEKWVNFLLQLLKITIESCSNEQKLLPLIEDNFFRTLIGNLSQKYLDENTKNKIYDILQLTIEKVNLISKRIYHPLLSFLISQLVELEQQQKEKSPRRQKIIKKMSYHKNSLTSSLMELQ